MAQETSKVKFQTILLQSGKTATGLQVPPEVVEQLGAGKRPPVHVTINGYTYRSSIAVMNSVYMLPVSAAVREQAQVAAGDQVDVEVQLDTDIRELAIPADFEQALAQSTAAKRYFDGLSYSNKQRFVLPIGEAKTAETRQKRIDKAISSLEAGKNL